MKLLAQNEETMQYSENQNTPETKEDNRQANESKGRSLQVKTTRPVSEWIMAQIKNDLLQLRPLSYEHLIVGFENLLDDRVEYIQTYKCSDDDFFEVEIGFNREDTGEGTLLIGKKIHKDEMLDVFTQVCMDGRDPRKIAAAAEFEEIDYLNEQDNDDEDTGDVDDNRMTFLRFVKMAVEAYREFGFSENGMKVILEEHDGFWHDWETISHDEEHKVTEEKAREYIKELITVDEFDIGVR